MDIGKPQRVITVEPLRLPDGFAAEPATQPAPAEPAPREAVTLDPVEEPTAPEPGETPGGGRFRTRTRRSRACFEGQPLPDSIEAPIIAPFDIPA